MTSQISLTVREQIRDEILELAARSLAIAKDIWVPHATRQETEEIAASLVRVANRVMGYE